MEGIVKVINMLGLTIADLQNEIENLKAEVGRLEIENLELKAKESTRPGE